MCKRDIAIEVTWRHQSLMITTTKLSCSATENSFLHTILVSYSLVVFPSGIQWIHLLYHGILWQDFCGAFYSYHTEKLPGGRWVSMIRENISVMRFELTYYMKFSRHVNFAISEVAYFVTLIGNRNNISWLLGRGGRCGEVVVNGGSTVNDWFFFRLLLID